MSSQRPTVISTFAGCGGSSLGYTLAGFKVLLAVEFDKNAVDCYRLNFPTTPVVADDIAKLSVKEVLRIIDLKPGELDIFDGSPPCQGFSTAKGHRDATDGRNSLFEQYARLLRGIQPKVFVFENVKGLTIGKMKPAFKAIRTTLAACGYNICTNVYDLSYYGVPQIRRRLLIVGYRKDLLKLPSVLSSQTKRISAGIALHDVLNDNNLHPLPGKFSQTGARMYCLVPPGKSLDSVYRILAKRSHGWGTLKKLDPHKTCPTICKLCNPRSGYGAMVHWSEARALTIQEIKRLSSFPDDYKLTGTFVEQWARIGNCVPPKFIAYLATHIRKELNL